MAMPILFVLSDDAPVLNALKRDLVRRFGNECRIVTTDSPVEGLAELESLAKEHAAVALLIVDEEMAEMPGVDFLERAHPLHPAAKRILLVERDYSAANPTVSAMMLGKIDYHLVKPWHPEQSLYPAVSEFLASWADSLDPTFLMFRIVGPEPSPRAHEIRDLILRFSLPYAYYRADSEEGRRLLAEIGRNDAPVPIVVRHDGKVLVDPTPAELIEALGGSTRLGTTVYDVAIVGAGPAGLTAAVYSASEGLDTVVLEQAISGGQAGTSSRIRNFPGFTWGIGGQDFAHRACEQAWLFGANMVFAQEAVRLKTSGERRIVTVADGQEISARVVVLATGVAWRRLGIPKLESLIGAGVFYGTGGSEARAMQGEHVCIVGAGNSAGQAATHLAKFAETVTLLVRGDSLAKSMSEYLILELEQMPNIRVRMGVELVDGEGQDRLEAVVIRDRATGGTEHIATAGLFVLIGGEPHTAWLDGMVARNPQGYILTGTDLVTSPQGGGWPMLRPPLHLETSIPGVFAIGDVRFRSVKRVASAVGEGASVVQLVHQYLGEGTLAPPHASVPVAIQTPLSVPMHSPASSAV